VLFIAFCFFLLVAPWIPSSQPEEVDDGQRSEGGNEGELPWFLSPTCGFVVLLAGVVYWFMWMHAIPWIRHKHIVELEVLTDEGDTYTTFKSVQGRKQYSKRNTEGSSSAVHRW
jgi:hypothetical protein